MSTRWVQHISGVGEKWKLHDTTGYNGQPRVDWCVHREGYGTLFLPKSEFVEVPAPEVWRDVSADCALFGDAVSHGILHQRLSRYQSTQWGEEGYRLRKVQVNRVGPGVPHGCQKQWAFLIEQKVQP